MSTRLIGKAPKGVKLTKPCPRKKTLAVEEEMKNILKMVEGVKAMTSDSALISEKLLGENQEIMEYKSGDDIPESSSSVTLFPAVDNQRTIHSAKTENSDDINDFDKDENANTTSHNMRAPRRLKLQKPRPLKKGNTISSQTIEAIEANILKFMEHLQKNEATLYHVTTIKRMIQKYSEQLRSESSGILLSCFECIEEAMKRDCWDAVIHRTLGEVLSYRDNKDYLTSVTPEILEKETIKQTKGFHGDCSVVNESDLNGNVGIPNGVLSSQILRAASNYSTYTTTEGQIHSLNRKNIHQNGFNETAKLNIGQSSLPRNPDVAADGTSSARHLSNSSDKIVGNMYSENTDNRPRSAVMRTQQSHDSGYGDMDDMVLWDSEDALQIDINENIGTIKSNGITKDTTIEALAGLQIIGKDDTFVKEAVDILKKHFAAKNENGIQSNELLTKPTRSGSISAVNNDTNTCENSADIINGRLNTNESDRSGVTFSQESKSCESRETEGQGWTCKPLYSDMSSTGNGSYNRNGWQNNSEKKTENVNKSQDSSTWSRWRSRSDSRGSNDCSDVESQKGRWERSESNSIDRNLRWNQDLKNGAGANGFQRAAGLSSPFVKRPTFTSRQTSDQMKVIAVREPLGPGSSGEVIKSVEQELPHGAYTAAWRRNMFLRYNTAVDIWAIDSDDLCYEEPIAYDRDTLLELSASTLSRKVPTEFSYLSKVFPEVCAVKVSGYFNPAQLYQKTGEWSPSFIISSRT